jgi:hypothetical protein
MTNLLLMLNLIFRNEIKKNNREMKVFYSNILSDNKTAVFTLGVYNNIHCMIIQCSILYVFFEIL